MILRKCMHHKRPRYLPAAPPPRRAVSLGGPAGSARLFTCTCTTEHSIARPKSAPAPNGERSGAHERSLLAPHSPPPRPDPPSACLSVNPD